MALLPHRTLADTHKPIPLTFRHIYLDLFDGESEIINGTISLQRRRPLTSYSTPFFIIIL